MHTFFKQLYIYFITVCLLLQCLLNLNSIEFCTCFMNQLLQLFINWQRCHSNFSSTLSEHTGVHCGGSYLVITDVAWHPQQLLRSWKRWRLHVEICASRMLGYCYVAGLFDNRMLTHLPLDNMDTISQLVHSNAFLWMRTFVFCLEFHWSLFLRVQLTISQHWFR